MKIIQLDKSIIKSDSSILFDEDVFFLCYLDYPCKDGKSDIKKFSSKQLKRMSISKIFEGIENPNWLLIRIEKD